MDTNMDASMDTTGAGLSPDALYGTILRSFRKRGLRETAAQIPINFSHLAKWERGERSVPQEMVAALDRAYAANGALVTLHELIKRDRIRTLADAVRPLWPGTGPASPPGGGEAHRAARRLFPAISAATGTPAPVLEALAAAEELAIGVRAAITQRDGIDVAEWERRVWECGMACCTSRPGAPLGRLTLDYARACHLLAHHPAPAQGGLLRAAAHLAALAAMQWSDLAQQALAVHHWELARAAADSSGDRDLRVWVRARQAHHEHATGYPEPALARLIDEAITIADDAPGTGLALAHATRALQAAGRGDAEGTRTALRNFSTVADRLPTGGAADDQHALPLWDLPPWTRAYHRAYPCILIGDTARAVQAITEAETLCPPCFPGHTADLRLYRAHTLITDHDIDHGLDLALTAAQSWPLTATRRHLLTRLLTALPAEAHAHPTTRTLHHLV